jgi:hypothetical protein
VSTRPALVVVYSQALRTHCTPRRARQILVIAG